MKKLLILLSVLFSLHRIEAQTITLRNIAPKYYNVKNISYTCDNADFSELFKTELEKRYKVNQQGVKPDAEVKIVAKVVTYTEQTRAEKEINIELRNQNNQYAGEIHRKVKALYHHYQQLEYRVIIDNEVFPSSKYTYNVELANKESKDPKIDYIGILPGYDKKKVVEMFAFCPLMYSTSNYNANSDELLLRINEYTIDDIIAQGQNINGLFGDNKKTILMYAIELNNNALFEKILAHKSNLEQKDKNGWTAYMYAKILVRDNFAKRLAALGANVSSTDNMGKNAEELTLDMNAKPLMINAIRNKDVPMIKNLLAKGVKVAENDKDKAEYLKAAIFSDNIEIINVMVEQGISLSTIFNYTETVSDLAASYRCFVVLNYFLGKNINFHTVSYNFKWLVEAYNGNFKNLVLIVLSANKVKTEDFTLLLEQIIKMKDDDFADKIMALPQKQTYNLESLGNSFAELEPKQVEKYLTGFTYEPFKYEHHFQYLINKSLYRGNLKLFYWYLSDPAFKLLTVYNNPSETTLFKKSCEQMSCIVPDPEICMQSFKKWPQYVKGLDLLNIVPLNYFIEKGYDDMVEYLINNGADMNGLTTVLRKNSKTFEELLCPAYSVLDLAIKSGNKDVIDVLQKNGAKSWISNKHNLFVEEYMQNYDSLLLLLDIYKVPDFVATDSVVLNLKTGNKKIIALPGQSFYSLMSEKAYDPKVQKIIIKLLDYGYKLNDNYENPILNKVLSGSYPDYDFVNRLIKEGAIIDHPYFVENGNKSPLFMMSVNNHWKNDKILELLLKNGAKLDTKLKDSKENTIRKRIQKEAKYSKDEKVIELLKKY